MFEQNVSMNLYKKDKTPVLTRKYYAWYEYTKHHFILFLENSGFE